jgi:prepilin-type N-terminal cleavage/methylation domain-containing protein
MYIKKKGKGFTLIELLVVVAIIGVLATVVLASLGSAREKAKIAKSQSEMKQIAQAFQMYLLDSGKNGINLPPSANEGRTSWSDPDCSTAQSSIITGNDFPNGAFLPAFPQIDEYFDSTRRNPWGQPYEIDSIYDCNQGQIGCNGGWTFSIVANRTSQGSNTYDPKDIVYTICTHP